MATQLVNKCFRNYFLHEASISMLVEGVKLAPEIPYGDEYYKEFPHNS
jgi:hypothetical protein